MKKFRIEKHHKYVELWEIEAETIEGALRQLEEDDLDCDDEMMSFQELKVMEIIDND